MGKYYLEKGRKGKEKKGKANLGAKKEETKKEMGPGEIVQQLQEDMILQRHKASLSSYVGQFSSQMPVTHFQGI